MDLTKLMKGPAEAEPVQEQPKLSREEYAAQKKAEREELWTRIDALTVDAFKDGSSLRGFLDFTAQCSPERIENLLLFHSDAPEATWLKTFDEWKQAGRSVRGGEVGYTALIGQDYTREDGTAASGYYVGKKFDVSQTRGRQPDRAPVYAADELVTALFTNSPVRLAVSEAVPEGIQAQYAAQNRTIYVRNNMDAQTTFLAIAREQAAASYDIHDGRFSRAAYSAQSYCAAYVAAKKYGLDVRSFSFDRVCQMCSGLEPQEQRRFLSDVKQAAYTVERTVRRGLNEMELSATPEPACSVEVHASMEQTERPARTKRRHSRSGNEPFVFRKFSDGEWLSLWRCGSLKVMKQETEASAMARERLYRMTEIQRNMLVVALTDEYRKQKARGVPYPPIGRLAVRAEDAPRHKNRLPWDKERLYDLYLNDAEWRMARDALNALRSWRFSVGKGDGGTDDALHRVMSAKYKKAPER